MSRQQLGRQQLGRQQIGRQQILRQQFSRQQTRREQIGMQQMGGQQILRQQFSRQEIGQAGEKAAAAFLAARGYRLLERNWRCRSGEIDIIAEFKEQLVFVEVRTRQAPARYGSAAESVDWRKQQKLRHLAQVYLQQSGKQAMQMQFDVLAITWNGSETSIDHIKQAF